MIQAVAALCKPLKYKGQVARCALEKSACSSYCQSALAPKQHEEQTSVAFSWLNPIQVENNLYDWEGLHH